MATKKIFSIDGSAVSNLFSNLISYLKYTRFKVVNKEGKILANIPLYLAVILGIIFPFLTVAAIVLVLALSYNISLEHERKTEQILIDKK